MATTEIEQFWQDLIRDIKNNRVVLPALPEVALRTRKVVDSGQVNSTEIAKVISADAVLSMRLLQVANSPLYRTSQLIDDVKTAVTRLGTTNVRSLVTSLATEQLFQNKLASPMKKRMLAQYSEHSVHVAALAHVLADRYTSLDPDEAMLAGLIHDIGKLPIMEYSEYLPDLASDERKFSKVLEVLHSRVGALILKAWKFPEELVNVAAEHENLLRDENTDADFTDVVLIANLLSYVGTDHSYTKLDWSEIPAFRRLALTPEESIEVIKDAREEITELKRLFAV
jgi:putative nucleotidyltransferase with HDIG domain